MPYKLIICVHLQEEARLLVMPNVYSTVARASFETAWLWKSISNKASAGDIPGEHLCDCIDEWHRCNPGQLAHGVLSSNTALFGAVISDSCIIPTPYVKTEAVPQYTLNAQDRIAALKCKLFNLCTHQPGFVLIIKTRTQRAAAQNAKTSSEELVPDIVSRKRNNKVETAQP